MLFLKPGDRFRIVGHDVQASEDTQRAATGLGALGTGTCCWYGSHLGSLARANQPLGHTLLLLWMEELVSLQNEA